MWVLRSTDASIPCTARLLPGAKRTLGRGPSADFVVNAPLVSRVHCHLAASENELIIEDLQSTNGTFVNDERVQTSRLQDGDRIRVGRLVLCVSREEVAGATSSDAPA